MQEHLDGDPSTNTFSDALLDAVLTAVELQADAFLHIEVPDHGDWSWVPAVVFEDEAGYWRRARALSNDVDELCDTLEAWVGELARPYCSVAALGYSSPTGYRVPLRDAMHCTNALLLAGRG